MPYKEEPKSVKKACSNKNNRVASNEMWTIFFKIIIVTITIVIAIDTIITSLSSSYHHSHHITILMIYIGTSVY